MSRQGYLTRIILAHLLSNYRCYNKNGFMLKLRACGDNIYRQDSIAFISVVNKACGFCLRFGLSVL